MAATRTRIVGTTKIEQPIGEGGMAKVFRGQQRWLGRSVAVKVMLPKLARDKQMVQRFRREARTLASLHHENIVAVHDLVEKNRQIFMVLEYVDGIDAGALITEKEPLPLDVSLIIATSVARALEHAHFRRVIHRDVKPANVLVSKRGEVKLADFGIAKDMQEADLTSTGLVVGTPSYLAPELLKGKRADHRADLYATGVLLFQCLTGKKPFRGETPEELFSKILRGDRDRLRALAPSVPASVEAVVDRCLEPDIEKRYQRAADLRKALEGELNRHLDANPSAKMVGFLYSKGHATLDDLATLDMGELAAAHPKLRLSESDLAVVNAKRDKSIEIDLDDSAILEESSGTTTTKARRSPLAIAAMIAIALLLAGGVAYALVTGVANELMTGH